MSPVRHCSSCNTTHDPDEACPVTPTSLINAINRERNPFNSPRDPALPPYHLRNGISSEERSLIDNFEAEHRRRMGMASLSDNRYSDRERFMRWYDQTKLIANDPMNVAWEAWQAAQKSSP